MRHPHHGVLLPPEMDDASEAKKDAYAAETKRVNAGFCAAVFAIEDEAARLGVELDA